MVTPYKLKEGDILPDVNCDIKVSFIKINCKITNRKCLGFETITVPAGTFNCRKISQTTTVKAMGKSEINTSIEWEAEGIGTVRNEVYDKKSNLVSYSELTKIE
jgi:type 1 fimbria pilin